jgi:hypothetical protein
LRNQARASAVASLHSDHVPASAATAPVHESCRIAATSRGAHRSPRKKDRRSFRAFRSPERRQSQADLRNSPHAPVSAPNCGCARQARAEARLNRFLPAPSSPTGYSRTADQPSPATKKPPGEFAASVWRLPGRSHGLERFPQPPWPGSTFRAWSGRVGR